LEKRRRELEQFLQILMMNKELRNARESVRFLEMNEYCP